MMDLFQRPLAFAAWAALAAGAGAAPAADWSPRPGAGYVHARTQEVRPAADVLALAEEALKAGRRAEALELFVLLSDTSEDESVRRAAYRLRSGEEFAIRRYASAYQTCEAYLTRYPQAEDLPDMIRRELECARLMSEYGTEERAVGIFTYRTSRPGIDLLRKILERYPYEEFSDDYHYVLAELLFRISDLDGAGTEFELLMKNYPQSEWTPASLYQLALIALSRFDAAPYDGRPLIEARKRLRSYVETYPSGPQIELVRRKTRDLDELEADRAFRIAEYYADQGRPASARYYYTLIASLYPDTFWGSESALRIRARGSGR